MARGLGLWGMVWWGRGQYGVEKWRGILRDIFNCITTSTSVFHCFTERCKDRLDLRGVLLIFLKYVTIAITITIKSLTLQVITSTQSTKLMRKVNFLDLKLFS